MTNKEKHEEKLWNLMGRNIGVCDKTGEPETCGNLNCLGCLFKNTRCFQAFREWLDAEYTELVKTVKASTLAVDTKVICWIGDKECGVNRYFAKVENGKLYAYRDGGTSWSNGGRNAIAWNNMALEDGTIILAE